MKLIKDRIWREVETFELFQKNVLNKVYLNPSMIDDTKEQIRIVEKLLLLSYYEYQFIDVAMTQVVFVLEKALKFKWQQLHNEHTRKNFSALIKWAFDEGYFESYNIEFIEQLRQIRNHSVHNETHSFGGVVFLNKVYHTIDLINDLYEDALLRKQRKEVIKTLQDQFNVLFANGAIQVFDNTKMIVYKAYPIFINNKKNIAELKLSVCLIFDLDPYNNNTHYSVNHSTFTLVNWTINNDIFTATEKDTNKPFTLYAINDTVNQKKFDKWHNDFLRLPNQFVVQHCVVDSLGGYFIQSLRELHKTEPS